VKRLNKKNAMALAIAAAISTGFSASVFAHGGIDFGADGKPVEFNSPDTKLEIIIGMNNEPAFEDEKNGLDMFPFAGTGDPIDTRTTCGPNGSKQDVVNLSKLEILILKKEQYYTNAQLDTGFDVISREDMTKPTRPAFGTDNAYRNYFRPTHNGVYAWHFAGTFHNQCNQPASEGEAATESHDQPVTIDEYYICGQGKPPIGSGTYGCIQDMPSFPGKLRNGKDKDGYEDNDKYQDGLLSPTEDN
jgi:hypothetical protein